MDDYLMRTLAKARELKDARGKILDCLEIDYKAYLACVSVRSKTHDGAGPSRGGRNQFYNNNNNNHYNNNRGGHQYHPYKQHQGRGQGRDDGRR